MQLATAFEAQLAAGQPHDLPPLQAPKQPPIDPSLSAPEVRTSQGLPTALRSQVSASLTAQRWTNQVLCRSRKVVGVLS